MQQYIYLVRHNIEINESEKSFKDIGFFSTEEIAESIIDYYCKNVPGFNLYPMGFEIIKLEILDYETRFFRRKHIYYLQAWDVVKDYEINFKCIGVFIFKKNAISDKMAYMAENGKRKYCIDKYLINEPEWKEGFCLYRKQSLPKVGIPTDSA